MTDHCPLTATGRLAPSPTGAQHVGNARTYLVAWLSARSRGGRVVLRGEDIDSPRVKAGAGAALGEGPRWPRVGLGGGTGGPTRRAAADPGPPGGAERRGAGRPPP